MAVKTIYTGRSRIDPKTGIKIYETAIVSNNRPCKECGNEPREDHNSRCVKCIQKNIYLANEREHLRRRGRGQALLNNKN